MQRTRINTLVENTGVRLNQALINPWRRISISVISLLLGFFVGTALSTTAGQTSAWDITSSALLLLFVEIISWNVYKQRNQNIAFLLTNINLFKMGIIYSLFLEAFKVGS